MNELLDRWPPPAQIPDLRGAVRREIAVRTCAASQPGWRDRLEAAFARPSFAVTFVVACVLLGLFLAEARLSRLHAAYGAQIARSYVQLIDPLIGWPPAPAPATRKETP